MANLFNVLKGSFQLLLDRPQLFVPKLFSTALGALWFIGLLSRTGPLLFYAATGPFLVILGLAVSVTLAGMVRNRNSDSILAAGFGEMRARWVDVILASLGIMVLGLVLYLPLLLGVGFYIFYGVFPVMVAGVLVTLALFILMAFLVYFFPIALLEKGGLVEGLKDSATTSMGNSKEVMTLTLFSFLLLLMASLSGNQGMKLFGYAGFLSLRIISGIVTTYIFVVSPEYYLES